MLLPCLCLILFQTRRPVDQRLWGHSLSTPSYHRTVAVKRPLHALSPQLEASGHPFEGQLPSGGCTGGCGGRRVRLSARPSSLRTVLQLPGRPSKRRYDRQRQDERFSADEHRKQPHPAIAHRKLPQRPLSNEEHSQRVTAQSEQPRCGDQGRRGLNQAGKGVVYNRVGKGSYRVGKGSCKVGKGSCRTGEVYGSGFQAVVHEPLAVIQASITGTRRFKKIL